MNGVRKGNGKMTFRDIQSMSELMDTVSPDVRELNKGLEKASSVPRTQAREGIKTTVRVSHQHLVDRIVKEAHLRHWLVAYYRPARTKTGWRTPVGADGQGCPDLFLVRPPQIMIMEVKIPPDKVSRYQERWIKLLEACPSIKVMVCTPSDWDKIVKSLW